VRCVYVCCSVCVDGWVTSVHVPLRRGLGSGRLWVLSERGTHTSNNIIVDDRPPFEWGRGASCVCWCRGLWFEKPGLSVTVTVFVFYPGWGGYSVCNVTAVLWCWLC